MRKGMAVPVVLAFLIAMTSFGIFVFQFMRQQTKQNIASFHQLQANFLARAGMEHALLKVKFLQRELYDAVCLAQGRNPLFDFSRPIDINTNPGPIFLYRKGEATPNLENFMTPTFDTLFASRPNPPRIWLNSFIADLTSGAELSLGVGKNLRVNHVMRLFPIADDMKPYLNIPFKSGVYEVTGLDVVAQGVTDSKTRVLNQMVVEITVKAELTNNFNDKWKQTLKRTVRISRDSQF